jgi:hypothetical protein
MKGPHLVLAALAATAVAGPAHAAEPINGTYTGKLRCTENADGAPARSKQDLELRAIEDTGVFAIGIYASGQPYALRVEGPIVEETAKPDRATLAGLDCDYRDVEERGLALHAEAVIKSGNGKGTIKGTLTRQSGGGGRSIEICTFSAKRTDTAMPTISACPP